MKIKSNFVTWLFVYIKRKSYNRNKIERTFDLLLLQTTLSKESSLRISSGENEKRRTTLVMISVPGWFESEWYVWANDSVKR